MLCLCALFLLVAISLKLPTAEARGQCRTSGLGVSDLTATGTTCKMARSVAAHASKPLDSGGCAFLRNGLRTIKRPCVRLGYHCKPLFHSASLRAYYVRCRKSEAVAIHFLL
mgnify:CR=1 FL=1